MHGMVYVGSKNPVFNPLHHHFPPFFTPRMAAPISSPEYKFQLAPSHAAATSFRKQSPSKIIDNLSPPLIAMFAVIGTAFLIVLYVRLLSRQIRNLHRRYTRWRRCRHILHSAASESQYQFSPPPAFPFSADSFSDQLLSPYGLDDAAIKTLPLSLFSRSKAKQPASTNKDCAVCLFEFDNGEWLRTLLICAHVFHVKCIDVWLRSHPSCPLCRTSVSFQPDSHFVPIRAARIRPSFDEIIIDQPPPPVPEECFLLKRSYSFGFEQSVGAEAATTASPVWRLWQQQQSQHRGFWSKRWASPFGGGWSARPYYHRGGGSGVAKSPLVRRFGFVPASAVGGRRCRSMTSPSVGFSSSRMRCGDPEALLSPERFNRR